MTRVRGFTQDDAHIFCTPDQVKSEFFGGVMDIVMKIFKALDFKDFITQVSLRDPNNKENTSVPMRTGKKLKMPYWKLRRSRD